MINVWLKVRKRYGEQDEAFIIRHLDFWLDIFKDINKYQLWLYNEDFLIPDYFKSKLNNVNYVNKKTLLELPRCQHIAEQINKSPVISGWWKPTALALALPFFYFEEEQYIYNIDSDDLKLEGPALHYLETAFDFAKENQLETISYDMLYSKNGESTIMPNLWTFGLNISSVSKMREIILKNIFNKDVPAEPGVGCSLDITVNHYLKSVDNFICFSTPDKLHHMEVVYTKYNQEQDKMETARKFGSEYHSLFLEKLPKIKLIF